MYCRVIGLLATTAILFAAYPAGAQTPGQDPVPFDPPETEYSTGARDNDPAIERGLPG